MLCRDPMGELRRISTIIILIIICSCTNRIKTYGKHECRNVINNIQGSESSWLIFLHLQKEIQKGYNFFLGPSGIYVSSLYYLFQSVLGVVEVNLDLVRIEILPSSF